MSRCPASSSATATGCRSPPGDPVVSLEEGSTPLVLAPRALRARRRRGVAEARGRQPDRLVQGPRDDLRGLAPPCARAPRRSSAPRPATRPPALAAYAARAGLRGAVIVPEGKIATGKLAQALMHGARVIALRGNFDEALELVRELRRAPPDRAGQLGQPVPPRGPEDRGLRDRSRSSATTRRAVHPGRQRGQHHRLLEGLPARSGAPPRMLGFQAAGAAPLVARRAGREPRDGRERDPHRQPGALGGGDGRDDAPRAARSRRSPTTQILDAYRFLAAARGRLLRAGVSAASVAGLLDARRRRRASAIVCVLTGHGLKDPQTALEQAGAVVPCEPRARAVERAVLG